MATQQLRLIAAFTAVSFLLVFAANLSADAADGPNRVTPSDVAVGRWVDSLLDSKFPTNPQARNSGPGRPRRAVQRRSGLQGKLVDNPNTSDGSPPFALVDRYGGILRYVEPVDSIDLQTHLGQTVGVRRDTGDILLASQLALPQPGRIGATGDLQLVQHQEPILAGEPIPAGEIVGESSIVTEGLENGPIYLDGGFDGGYEGGLDFGGCANCGSHVCRQYGGCRGSSRGRGYVRGEYLLWWFDGMDTPPLVTQSDPIDGGVLPNPGIPGDNPSTVILLGGEDVLDDPRNGGRLLFGVWIDDAGRQAIELDYLRFDTESLRFSAAGEDGNPTISRPFFDLFPDDDDDGIIDIPPGGPSEAAEQVSSATIDGRVTVQIDSDFESFGIRFRHNLCGGGGCATGCGSGVGCGYGVGCGSGVGCGNGVNWGGGQRRVDLLTGFRYARLDESLYIREDLTVDAGDAGPLPPGLIIPPDGTQFIVQDLFRTKNEFVGGEVGFLWEIEQQRWTLELLSKMAIGSTRQRATILGSTTVITTPPTVPAPPPSVGGLLAQSSNIGSYERNEFSVIPEIGFTVGYQIRPRLKLTAGYTLLYWTNVLRPGDQIDREINGTLIPDFDATGAPIAPGPLVGPLRPEFNFVNTNLWAQGLNLGGELSW